MPRPAKPRKPRPAGHTFPGRQQVNLSLSDQTVGLLEQLCEARAAEYRAQGVNRPADKLKSEVVARLIYQAAARLASSAT